MKALTLIAATTVMTCMTFTAHADIVTRKVAYDIDGQAFEGMLVYDDSISTPRPGLLMVPNWMGPTDNAARKAARVAGTRYVVFVADMYGVDVRPSNMDEAAAAAGAVRGDRPLQRKRAMAALDVLRAQDHVPMRQQHIGAVGFCFGGGSVLELARAGAGIGGVVSFHGNLDTPDPADARAIQAPILVLHGADDPYVPAEQVSAFEAEMRDAGVDWQLVSYGGAVHSFTDPTANMPGEAEYNARVAGRAFDQMNLFLDEQFER
ncbi:MAG: dienelactone hydrolase family protein [Alcanivorax sp.]|nr:dienelactone hydrolase family protein [Alcanivorax sp.]